MLHLLKGFLSARTLNLNNPERAAIKDAISKHANAFALSKELIASIVWQESKGETLAQRYEDSFYIRYVQNKARNELLGYVPIKVSLATEKRNRAFSWGPMQVMGQTARELGFQGDHFGELLSADLGIEYGCRYLTKCMLGNNRDVKRALDSYNGGGNPDYSTEVFLNIDRKLHEIFL